jgi:hypothetical protein
MEHLLHLKSQRPQHGSVESSDNEVGIRVARMSIDKGENAKGNHRDKKGFKEQKNGEPPVQGKIILYTVIQKAVKYLKILLISLQKQSLKLERQKINMDNILPFV